MGLHADRKGVVLSHERVAVYVIIVIGSGESDAIFFVVFFNGFLVDIEQSSDHGIFIDEGLEQSDDDGWILMELEEEFLPEELILTHFVVVLAGWGVGLGGEVEVCDLLGADEF